MQRKLDQWTTALAVVVIVGALLACKKRTGATTSPSAETAVTAPAAAAPPPAEASAASPAAAAADANALKLGDVKRYPDKEKAQTGAVRILADGVKVFNEADDKTADVATLGKDLLVFRLASMPDWELVEFPSGIGKVSPGWVPAKFVDVKTDAKVERDAVASQSKQAVVKTGSAAAKPSASVSASTAAASASASAKAAADKAAAAKAAADKAAADKAAADKLAADAKAAADKAAARAKRIADRAAAAAKAAAGGTTAK